MGLVQMTPYAIGCLPSLPCRHCVKPAKSAPGGKASLVIGSRKTIEIRKKRMVLLQSLLQGELKSLAEWAGSYPVYLTIEKHLTTTEQEQNEET